MTIPINEIQRYIAELDRIYRQGNATEHSYRGALQTLFEQITTGLAITNEPKHIACGAPDYIITRNDIPIGYIEAKDIPVGIYNKANKEQFDRYKQSLNNLIITDYLSFQLFVDGVEVVTITIAKENNGAIAPDEKQFDAFMELARQFTGFRGKSVYQSEQLAKMMAAKAKLLAGIIENALYSMRALRNTEAENDTLSGQLEGFRKILIHDLSIPAFADIYAQTLAYGMFAARLNAPATAVFSRQAAANLIPQSNPFLRKFFQYIAGFDLDSRICWIVDALADLFNYVAVEDILKEFGKANQDPYIHFYETFLAEYDPKLRESRGVYYTPLPVVQFIVQAVDDILQKDFNLPRGLADNSKIKRPIAQSGGTKKDIEFHKVQILDPATGTGTFLAEVIDTIYKRFAGQKGMWVNYCAEHLIPRLNGFEILMASYAMAHFKLDMKLKETGYQGSSRLRVYLTNSLEGPDDVISRLPMVEWLTSEGNEANSVKRNSPVMVILGNPPYSVSSQNKGEWINNLMAVYKTNLNERNIQPLSDDYIKFIRYGQFLINKNRSGILAYISNNSFIDGLIHRQMRKDLLGTFDKIYILDLHGNSRKKESILDDGRDENVFDIQQGVSINIFVKNGSKGADDFAGVFHYDLYGKRAEKYHFLLNNNINSVAWKELPLNAPQYFFVPKNFSNQKEYEEGFSIQELFTINSSGVKTHDDANLVDFSPFPEHNQLYDYRPFDTRYINYDLKKVKRHRYEVMQHFLKGENVGLITCRQQSTFDFQHVLLSKHIIDMCAVSSQTKETGYIFPLYLYPESGNLDSAVQRRPNLNKNIVDEIVQRTGLRFVEEDDSAAFAPIDLLDYIYAVLYSNNYRAKYKELLKIDFPCVPYPENKDTFQELSKYGAALRNLHLLEHVEPLIDTAAYPIEGNNCIDQIAYKNGNVYINKTQYFEHVSLEVWEYYIGGYQPAQKWLKDRKERELDYDDISHYQKIITALSLTIGVQAHIDTIIR